MISLAYFLITKLTQFIFILKDTTHLNLSAKMTLVFETKNAVIFGGLKFEACYLIWVVLYFHQTVPLLTHGLRYAECEGDFAVR